MSDATDREPGGVMLPRETIDDPRVDRVHPSLAEPDESGDATTGPDGAVATMGNASATGDHHERDATTGPDGAVATMGNASATGDHR